MPFSQSYRVAGVDFSVNFSDSFPCNFSLDNCKPFEIEEVEGPLFELRDVPELARQGTKVELPEPESVYETRVDLFRCEDGTPVFEMAVNYKTPICARLRLSKDCRLGEIALLEPSFATFAVNNALMLMFALSTADKNLLEMHASVVVNDGLGYLFLGKSGTGKSTHSQLWIKNIPGTRLLNDDNPILGVKDGVATVYGSPWSGKTPCYINASAPVGAIVSLSQAPYNKIRKQSIFEAYASIYSSCSGLKFEESSADALHATLEAVVTNVNCFALECLPDADAAKVCREAVMPGAECAEEPSPAGISDVELMNQVCELLEEGRSVVLKPKGYSMLPFIRPGRDSVVLKKQPVQPGDPVLANLGNGRFVLHRVIEIAPDGRVTMAGDGNLNAVEYCALADIIGTAVAVVRPDGSEKTLKSSLKWRKLPYICRRLILAIYRRII